MQMDLVSALNEIWSHIRAVNDEPLETSGLSNSEIARKLQEIGLEPVPDLVKLYEWRNGISSLNAFLSLLDLDSAIRAYKFNRSTKLRHANFKWEESWFTVLDMNGDIQICVDLNTKSVFSVDVECDITYCIASHYSRYLNALIEIFRSKRYSFDAGEGCIDIDHDYWKEIQAEYSILTAWE